MLSVNTEAEKTIAPAAPKKICSTLFCETDRKDVRLHFSRRMGMSNIGIQDTQDDKMHQSNKKKKKLGEISKRTGKKNGEKKNDPRSM